MFGLFLWLKLWQIQTYMHKSKTYYINQCGTLGYFNIYIFSRPHAKVYNKISLLSQSLTRKCHSISGLAKSVRNLYGQVSLTIDLASLKPNDRFGIFEVK